MDLQTDINRAESRMQYGQADTVLKEGGILFNLAHDLQDHIDTLQKLIDMVDKSYEGVMQPRDITPQKPDSPPANRPGSSPLARQLSDAILRLEIQNSRLDMLLSRSEV